MSRCFAAIVSAVTRRRGCDSLSIVPEFHFGIHDGHMWSCIEDKPRIERIERIIGGDVSAAERRKSLATAARCCPNGARSIPRLSRGGDALAYRGLGRSVQRREYRL